MPANNTISRNELKQQLLFAPIHQQFLPPPLDETATETKDMLQHNLPLHSLPWLSKACLASVLPNHQHSPVVLLTACAKNSHPKFR
jgi:hypothetical protein